MCICQLQRWPFDSPNGGHLSPEKVTCGSKPGHLAHVWIIGFHGCGGHQEAASKAAAGETAQLLSERTELQQRLRKTRDCWGGKDIELVTVVGWLWGLGLGGLVGLLFDLGICFRFVMNVCLCVKLVLGFFGDFWIWGIECGLDLGWLVQSQRFFQFLFVFCMDISITHVFLCCFWVLHTCFWICPELSMLLVHCSEWKEMLELQQLLTDERMLLEKRLLA